MRTMTLVLLVGLGLIGLGCMPQFEGGWEGDDDSGGNTGDDDTGDDDTTMGDEPDIEVAPEAVTINNAPVGTPTSADLLVRNVGTAPLTVFELKMAEGQDGGGIISVATSIFQIMPGNDHPLTGVVTVTCTEATPASGWIEIYSDDPDENPYNVGVGVTCAEIGPEE